MKKGSFEFDINSNLLNNSGTKKGHSFAFNSNLMSHINNTIKSDFKINEKKDNIEINDLSKLLEEKLNKLSQKQKKDSVIYFNELSQVIYLFIVDI